MSQDERQDTSQDKQSMERWSRFFARLHADERGAEALEKLFIIAAIVLPLVGLLWWFSDDLAEWVGDRWEDVKGESNPDDLTPG